MLRACDEDMEGQNKIEADKFHVIGHARDGDAQNSNGNGILEVYNVQPFLYLLRRFRLDFLFLYFIYIFFLKSASTIPMDTT